MLKALVEPAQRDSPAFSWGSIIVLYVMRTAVPQLRA
jgi:hypothetical protein